MLKVAAAAALLLVPVLASAQGTDTAPPPMPAGPGKAIVQRSCVACHSITVVTSKRAEPDEWNQLVQTMVSRGADLTDDEIPVVIKYLSDHYGPVKDQKAAPAPPPPPANK
jgi:mono/diheme cytochrome c family protein